MTNPTLPRLLFLLSLPALILPLHAGAQEAEPPAEAPVATSPPEAVPEPPPVVLTPEAVNAAMFDGNPLPEEGQSPIVLKLQVLLDRAGFSPGVIDGVMGDNVSKAITATEFAAGLPQDGLLDAEVWNALQPLAETPALVGYRITAEDLAEPFVPDLPSDYAALAKLPRSAYRTPSEMFAERFHMDQNLLLQLNEGVDFGMPGTVIAVTAVGAPRSGTPVTHIIADKTRAQLLGYGADNRLVVSYPATIGSAEMPSPSGMHLVNAIAHNAAYYYRPEVNFQQGDNTGRLTIPPGPNNPIGTTWIDLTEPTYGIHGTPEPARIDKTSSHGCVRLTNWDVEELAALVEKGVPVEFR
jgi:lipoprotein-anchoring transpeptidase ErfK/SrfK